jgi:hypothetical protein
MVDYSWHNKSSSSNIAFDLQKQFFPENQIVKLIVGVLNLQASVPEHKEDHNPVMVYKVEIFYSPIQPTNY